MKKPFIYEKINEKKFIHTTFNCWCFNATKILKMKYSSFYFKTGTFLLISILLFGCKKVIVFDEYPTIQYEHQDIGTSETLNAISFFNTTLGFAAGNNGALFKYTQGSWANISINNATYDINDVEFIDANNGFICTSNGVLKTTDGGSSWLSVSGMNGVFNDIFFLNANIGFIVGGSEGFTYGFMYKTINGGVSWQELTLYSWPGRISGLKAVHFVDENIGFAVGYHQVYIETTDGGVTWTGYKNGHPADPNYTDIFYIDADNGYRTGEEGYLYEQPSYSDLNPDVKYDIFAIDFYGQNGLAVGENGVFRHVEELSDHWGTWSCMLTPEGKTFKKTYYDVSFLDANNAFAVGENGIVTKFKYD